jgi:hypothetical protein
MITEEQFLSNLKNYYLEELPPIRGLLMGDTGTGKTHFLGTCPKPLILDIDKGGLTLRKNKEAIAYPIFQYDENGRPQKVSTQVKDVLDGIFKGKFGKDFETIAIDSLTELSEMLLWETMMFPASGGISRDPTTSKAEWDDYRRVKSILKEFSRYFKDISRNKHLFVTCGTSIEQNELTGNIIGEPTIVGSYSKIIGYDFDAILVFEKKLSAGNLEYKASTKPVGFFQAKSRGFDPQTYINPNFTQIFKENKA